MPGLTPAVRLLAEAVEHGLGCVAEVGSGALSRPTPCAGWDLADLLWHPDESMRALREAPEPGGVKLVPVPRDEAAEGGPVSPARRSARVPANSSAHEVGGAPKEQMAVAGLPLPGDAVAVVGALEIAVHGWDVAEACGRRRPIPAQLARTMLWWAPLVVDEGARPVLFAPALSLPDSAAASDRLVAHLGQQPGGAVPVSS